MLTAMIGGASGSSPQGVQALAGILLASACLFLFLLANDGTSLAPGSIGAD